MPTEDNPINEILLRDWWTLRLSLIWAYWAQPVSRKHYEADPGSSFQIWRVDAGYVRLRSRSKWSRGRSGEWLVMAGDKQGHEFSGDAKLLSINLVAHWMDDQPLFALNGPLRMDASEVPRLNRRGEDLVRACPAFALPHRQVPAMLAEPSSPQEFMRIRACFHSFVEVWIEAMLAAGARLTRTGRIDPRCAEAIRHIDANAVCGRVDQRQLARRVGLSVSQLNRLFVRDIGITPETYQQRERINHAKRAVIESTVPIKQIAYSMGFRHLSHFSVWFRRKVGCSPRNYRENGD